MSFAPFAVQCPTCGSRLRVTDPSIVDTIAACPKCYSMVQIQRPPAAEKPPASQLEQQVAVGQSDVDSQAITEDGIVHDQDDSLTSQEMPVGFSGSEDLESEDATASGIPPQWQSDRTKRSRQIALVVALSFSGLLTAGVLFSWFVRSWQTSATQTEQTVSPTPEQPDIDQSATGDELSISSESEVDQATESTTPETVDSKPTEDQPGNKDQSGMGDAVEPSPETTSKERQVSEPIPTDLLPQSSIPETSTLKDPATANLSADPKPATNKADEDRGTMQDLPPELARFAPFLLQESPTAAPTLKAPPTMDEIKIEAATEDGPESSDIRPVKTLNLKADLAIELALASEGYRLADLILLVSQITGVPIQLDWVSLDMAGIDIDRQVKIRGRRSARQLLDDVSKSLGGEIREEETLILFTLTDATFDEVVSKITNLTDFGDSQASAILTLNQFLDEDPDARELQIGPTRQEKQLAILAVESLRRMRGIESKIPDQRLRRWAQATEHELVQWPTYTGGNAGPQYDAPITVAGFLRRTAKGNRSTCVVNWYDANRRGLLPEKLLIPFAQVDAATTLDRELSPFGIQVRQVDSEHWWIGSESTYDHLPVVVWTSPLGNSRDMFSKRIAKVMSANPTDVFMSAIDDESDRALLLLPRYIVRQLPKIAASIAAK